MHRRGGCLHFWGEQAQLCYLVLCTQAAIARAPAPTNQPTPLPIHPPLQVLVADASVRLGEVVPVAELEAARSILDVTMSAVLDIIEVVVCVRGGG